jgi:MFS family permease
MLGNLLSAVLWLFSSSFGVYAFSRLVGGLSEGNVQLSIAVISDVTTPVTRSKSLALVGVAFSLAFTLGPSLGAYFASRTMGRGSKVSLFGKEIALNGYAVPAAVTLILLTIETVYLAARLPETRWWQKEESEKELGDEKKEDAAGPPRSVAERLQRLRELEWIHLGFLFFFSGTSFQQLVFNPISRDSYFRWCAGAEFTLTFLTYTLFDYTNAVSVLTPSTLLPN